MNAFGEVPGGGPQWACSKYGTAGHNYMTCRDCLAGFNQHMDQQEANDKGEATS